MSETEKPTPTPEPPHHDPARPHPGGPAPDDAEKQTEPVAVRQSPVGGVLVQSDPPAQEGLSTPETRAQHPVETAAAAAAARSAAGDVHIPPAPDEAADPQPEHEPPHAA